MEHDKTKISFMFHINTLSAHNKLGHLQKRHFDQSTFLLGWAESTRACPLRMADHESGKRPRADDYSEVVQKKEL